MTSRFFIAFAAAAACMAFACEISAHHSTAAEFDKQKPITFTGTVKKIQWMNPHIYTLVETRGGDGKSVVYRIEGGPPNQLFRQGWRMDSLKVGDTVTVSGLRAKNAASTNVGAAKITTAEGKRVFDGNAPGHEVAQP
jgi:Family of unknown function (DUF6152)